MDTLKLLDELHDLTVERPGNIPLIPLYWGLNKDEISLVITKIRSSLPPDIKTAANAARESERLLETSREESDAILSQAEKEAARIVQDARTEAELIIERARIEQQQLVNESEILRLTKAQIDRMNADADRDAVAMRRDAERYVYQLLSQIESVLNKAMTAVDNGKRELEATQPNPRKQV
jgi:cell division septum initiation protein DivIVA